MNTGTTHEEASRLRTPASLRRLSSISLTVHHTVPETFLTYSNCQQLFSRQQVTIAFFLPQKHFLIILSISLLSILKS